MADWASEDQQLSLLYTDLGIPGGNLGEKRRAEILTQYHAEKRKAIKANEGKKLDADQREKILNRLTMTGFRDSTTWYGGTDRTTKRVYQIPDTERKNYKVLVPKSANDLIVKKLNEKGIPATEQNVRNVYLSTGVK